MPGRKARASIVLDLHLLTDVMLIFGFLWLFSRPQRGGGGGPFEVQFQNAEASLRFESIIVKRDCCFFDHMHSFMSAFSKDHLLQARNALLTKTLEILDALPVASRQ